MGVLFINLAATLDTQKNGADNVGKTAGRELLWFFGTFASFATYLLPNLTLN